MVIYEVNLTVNNDIFSEYFQWLVPHLKEMLKFNGFCKAEVFKDRFAENTVNTSRLTVHYLVDTEEHLDDYLNNHAAAMRGESIKKFGDKFSATRRILIKAVE